MASNVETTPDIRLKNLARRYIAGLNTRDPSSVLALFDSDATVEDPVGGLIRKGVREIEAFYKQALSQVVAVELEGEPRGSQGDAVAYAMRVILPRVTLSVIGVLTFSPDGLITSMRAYHGPSDVAPAQEAT